jgi:pyrimidine-nucleoside phosphorylase
VTLLHLLDLILKKRDGQKLDAGEIDFLVRSYTAGVMPDYQMAAFLMAVFFQGLDFAETEALTRSFINSGDSVDLSDLPGIKADKHSTGGVGDKTTLVVVPLVAAAGVTVVKMSGRALGHTGGTLDKLESIPGFRIGLDLLEVKEIARRVGAVIAGQSVNLVPADKKIYALRDVTGTVDCLPLIASSVMSKKIAGGAQRIVLDVKVGSGAFLSDLPRARELADWMVRLGNQFNRRTVAVLSNMEQPLGRAVGNALEVREAVLTLQGLGPDDLTELCLTLAAQMLLTAEAAASIFAARAKVEETLRSGAGLDRFSRIIEAQGGLAGVIDHPELLPQAASQLEIKAPAAGYVQSINAREIGWSSLILGAGRLRKEDNVDPAVGIYLHKKVGDAVAAGGTLATLHLNRTDNRDEALRRVAAAYIIGPEPPAVPPLIY